MEIKEILVKLKESGVAIWETAYYWNNPIFKEILSKEEMSFLKKSNLNYSLLLEVYDTEKLDLKVVESIVPSLKEAKDERPEALVLDWDIADFFIEDYHFVVLNFIAEYLDEIQDNQEKRNKKNELLTILFVKLVELNREG